jgi:hypothetical protein
MEVRISGEGLLGEYPASQLGLIDVRQEQEVELLSQNPTRRDG